MLHGERLNVGCTKAVFKVITKLEKNIYQACKGSIIDVVKSYLILYLLVAILA